VVKAFVVLIVAWGAYLAWSIALALGAESVFVAGPRMAGDPWGWVTIVDVYLGFVVLGAFIVARERRLARALPWLAGLFVLGNVAGAAYLASILLRHRFDLGALLRAER